ncbi:hypothetical protein D9758_009339 [Tetrapyrgos nigripes]|uniref:Uncharacterized protein n=1 Tax=Tetrapyrgos nigripes TaxID=182062 RepID=A0A8H5GGT9_9AGAR|nr:hypothetical protein D9758_009339 [Tetrapyrgos nigripes]
MVKQMCIRHNGSLPEEERRFYRQVIYHNILESAQAIIEAMLNIGLLHSNQAAVDKISDLRRHTSYPVLRINECDTSVLDRPNSRESDRRTWQ